MFEYRFFYDSGNLSLYTWMWKGGEPVERTIKDIEDTANNLETKVLKKVRKNGLKDTRRKKYLFIVDWRKGR